jgi:uncharacterized sporulation protein YeaH/YhbH (DUF444 family)
VGEPSFGHAHGGVWEVVNPGNQEYLKGDQINRPKGGGGAGRGKAGNSDQTRRTISSSSCRAKNS